MKVVVTGAAGFIGSHLAEACLARGWEVVAIDPAARNAGAFRDDPGCTFVEQDLLDADLPALLSGAHVVFHLAAQAGVRASWGESFDEYTHRNVTVLQRLLEAAREAPLDRFVFASSSSVYGDAAGDVTAEDHTLRPLSPYGATKVLGEHLVYLYFRRYGLPALSLRYFSVYGPRQRPDMAFHRAIDAWLADREFVLYGDGRQTRDFTFVADAVAGTLAAAERGVPGEAYNLGGGAAVSMTDALELIRDELGRGEVRHVPARPGEARDTAADITRARAELGYEPAVAIADGLREQIEWHRRLRDFVPATLPTA